MKDNKCVYTCEQCGTNHDGSYGSGRFCSAHCRRIWIGKHSAHNGNHKCNFPHKRSAYGTWKCDRCNLVFETRKHLFEHNHQFHPIPAGSSWNKGLTQDTDKRVAQNVLCWKTKFANGEIKPSFQGRHHTIESKLLMSKKRLQNIDSGKCPGRVDVKWYDVQNNIGEIYKLRGHWEENVALKLNQLNVYWTKCKHYIQYVLPDGTKKFYNPDFVLPSLDAFIEVKGWFDDKDKLKMYCVQKQNPNMKIYFIDSTQYNDFISESGKLIDDLLYKNSSFYTNYKICEVW